MNKIRYDIKEIEKGDNSNKYKVKICVPINLGFIDYMYLHLEAFNGNRDYNLKFINKDEKYVYFENEIDIPNMAIYRYYFSYTANEKLKYVTKNNEEVKDYLNHDEKEKLSVNFKTPDWAKGKIMYHIFLDRFKRGNSFKPEEMKNRIIYDSFQDDDVKPKTEDGKWNIDFYGGDLKGIEEKLDYIKSLGVSIIYISPIVKSQSNHRYDTGDYEQVDPYAGNNDDLKSLCNKAHEKGIKIILDAVFNHTGNDSKYFNEYGNYQELGAYQSKDSQYYPFFRKHTFNNKTYFDYWWGLSNLPECDGYNKEWQEYIYGEKGVIDKWYSLGIDGLRLDVADCLTDEFIEGIKKAAKRNKEDSLIIGEVWKNPMRMNRGYISSGKGMDTVMNYPLIDALIRYYKYQDVNKLKDILNQIKKEYPGETINTLMNFTSTHDISRALNIFSSNEFNPNSEWSWNLYNDSLDYCRKYKLSEEETKRGKDIYKSYLFTLTFLPGILSIFYGDEAGIEGMGNLMNRKPYPWTKQDKDLVEYFKTLGYIREKEKFLEKANIEIIDINNNYLEFIRKNENIEALVKVSRTEEKIKNKIPASFQGPDCIYTLKGSNE